MKITIFGSGYVGLVTGACLAEAGNHVVCVDVDPHKIDMLNQGQVPIHEPGLDALIQKNQKRRRLEFTLDAAYGVKHGLFQMIAVGTPPDEDGSADLQYVLKVAQTVAQHMTEYKVIITKSTVPVGTGDRVRGVVTDTLAERAVKLDFDIVSNPEFLKEGAAIGDFNRPDRVIVGCDNPQVTELMRSLYEPFTHNHERLIVMDLRSAELTKYAANAMLATKISFMNEMANIAERLGADIEKIRHGIGSDPRIGYGFIYAGVGYGGSCFPKDVQALERSARQVGYESEILAAVESVNARQKRVLFQKIHKHFKGQLKGLRLGLWGLAFKPETDDMREAPSRVLLEELWQHGVTVTAYDPVAANETQRIYGQRPDLTYAPSMEDAAKGQDALIIVTEWKEFRSPDFDQLKTNLNNALIFDGRNLYDPKFMKKQGFTYYAIGRGESLGTRA